jgi:hypothetical protein
MARSAVIALAAMASLWAAPAQAERVTTGAGAYHILPTPAYQARTGRYAPNAAAAGQVLYYGGSVFANVKVVSVMWGPKVDAATVAGIPGFTAALVDSTYVDQMAQYDTFLNAVDGRPGTQQHIARGQFLGQFQIKPKNKSTQLADADVQAELKYQIKKGVLPARDLNTLYMVYFPKAVTITLDGLTSCRDFGAYHFATVDTELSKSNLFYSVEPSCGYSFSSITYDASHEFAEAMTDNVPTPGSSPAFPQAWNNSTGYEVGDLCGTAGTLTAATGRYNVTQFYLNSTGRCSTGNYTSP